MRFADAHIHLSDEEYSGCIDEILQESRESDVVALISNSMDLNTCVKSLDLAKQFPNLVYAAVGVHPWTVKHQAEDELQETLDFISKQAQDKRVIAIGEIGLDSKYVTVWDKQVKVFDTMLRLAEKLGLPVIVHSRGTTAQIVDMLPSYNVKKVLLHWFSNPTSALYTAVDRGFYISEGAPTVFSNGIRDVVRRVPIENLLTETDGPVRFFRPPFKGQRTTPGLIPTVVKAMAELLKMDTEAVAEHILSNFERLFGIRLN